MSAARIEHLAEGVTLYLGDCREILPTLGKVDAVLGDPPYGVTQNAWDSVVPYTELWPLLLSVSKDDAAIVLTAAQPFTSTLIASQIANFRYAWVWQKSRPTGHMNAKLQPLREHEDVCVFYRRQPIFNPQFTVGRPNHVGSAPRVKSVSENYGAQYEVVEQSTNQKYPKTILPFDVVSPTNVEHPTQKPVELFDYMVRTYSDEGCVVLDPFMGSGTTGVAAVKLGRKFIGIEIEPKYFDIACRRISEALKQPDMFIEKPKPLKQEAFEL